MTSQKSCPNTENSTCLELMVYWVVSRPNGTITTGIIYKVIKTKSKIPSLMFRTLVFSKMAEVRIDSECPTYLTYQTVMVKLDKPENWELETGVLTLNQWDHHSSSNAFASHETPLREGFQSLPWTLNPSTQAFWGADIISVKEAAWLTHW